MRLFSLILLAATVAAHAQFEMQESHTTASLRGIHAVGKGVAWASGTNGTVLRTEDGGKNWKGCAMPPGAEKLDFRGIQGFDANTAIVMSSGPGDLSRIYKTTDGCATWKLVFTNPDKDGFFDAYRLDTSRRSGIVIGDPVRGHFFVTALDKEGKPFKLQDLRHPPKGRKGEAAFAASNSALFVDSEFWTFWIGTGGEGGARIIKAVNHDFDMFGYYKFPAVEVPVGHRTASSGVFSLSFREDLHLPNNPEGYTTGVAVGGDYLKPDESSRIAVYTEDEGRHWLPSSTSPHGYRSAVAFDSICGMWITVGPNGTDASHDNGKNWMPLYPGAMDQPDADKNWNALSLPFVVGPKGRIGKLRPEALVAPAKK